MAIPGLSSTVARSVALPSGNSLWDRTIGQVDELFTGFVRGFGTLLGAPISDAAKSIELATTLDIPGVGAQRQGGRDFILGFGQFANTHSIDFDRPEDRRSAVLEDIVKPLPGSIARTAAQLPGILSPTDFAQSLLTGNPLKSTDLLGQGLERLGAEGAGGFVREAAAEFGQNPLISSVEAIGNVSLVSGGVIGGAARGASVATRLGATGTAARLSSVAASPLLHAFNRPVRSLVMRTVGAESTRVSSLFHAMRDNTIARLNQDIRRLESEAAIQGGPQPRRLQTMQATVRFLNEGSRQVSALLAEAGAKLNGARRERFVTHDTQTFLDTLGGRRGVLAAIRRHRGEDFQRLVTEVGFDPVSVLGSKDATPAQFLQVINALDSLDIRLRTRALPGEEKLYGDTRLTSKVVYAHARLHAQALADGLDPDVVKAALYEESRLGADAANLRDDFDAYALEIIHKLDAETISRKLVELDDEGNPTTTLLPEGRTLLELIEGHHYARFLDLKEGMLGRSDLPDGSKVALTGLIDAYLEAAPQLEMFKIEGGQLDPNNAMRLRPEQAVDADGNVVTEYYALEPQEASNLSGRVPDVVQRSSVQRLKRMRDAAERAADRKKANVSDRTVARDTLRSELTGMTKALDLSMRNLGKLAEGGDLDALLDEFANVDLQMAALRAFDQRIDKKRPPRRLEQLKADVERLVPATEDAVNALPRLADEAAMKQPVDVETAELRSTMQELLKEQRHWRDTTGRTIEREARKILNDEHKAQQAVQKIGEKLDETIAAVHDSIPAAPSGARPYLTFVRQVGPELLSAFKAAADQLGVGDAPSIAAMVEAMERLPRFTEALEATGARLFYLPDIDLRPGGTRTTTPSTALSEQTNARTRRRTVSPALVPQKRTDILFAESEAQALRQVVQEELVSEFSRTATKTSADALRAIGLSEAEARRQVTLGPEAVRRRLEQDGMVQYDPSALFGPFITRARVAPDARWLPQHLAISTKKVADSLARKDGWVGQLLDSGNRLWKKPVLGLRPGYVVNTTTGNALMAWWGGEITLKDTMRFLPYAVQVARKIRDGQMPELMEVGGREFHMTPDAQARLFGTSILRRETQLINEGRGVGTRLTEHAAKALDETTALEKPRRMARGGYRMAATAGDVATRVSKLADLGLSAGQLADDATRALISVAHAVKRMEADPSLTASQAFSEGIARAVRVVGDYSKQSTFARRTLRRAFPFWTWMSHLVSMIGKTFNDLNTVDQALVKAHLMYLMGEPNEYEELLPEWAAGSIHVGFNENGTPIFTTTRGLNPFADIAAGALSDPSVIAPRLLSSAGPLGTLVARGLLRIDPLDARPTSGTGVIGPGGREIAPIPSLTEFASDLNPQFRLGLDALRALRGEPLTRLDTGEPFFTRPGEERTLTQSLSQFAGLNRRPLDVQRMERERQQLQRSLDRRRQRVEARLSAVRQEGPLARLRDYVPFG